MSDLWMVYDNEEGLVCITDYENALAEYERCKEAHRDYVYQNGEFSGEESVVLAKVERKFFSFDTKKPVIKYDDNDNEIETIDTYWEFGEYLSDSDSRR